MTRHDETARRPVTELDRLLGEWLGDGPARAPEAPVNAAIAFARSHPRRRDPLAFLRPDPMDRRGIFGMAALAPAASPAFALLVLGLLLAAVVGIGVVGSQDRDPAPLPSPSVVVPGPTTAPSASPPPTASPSPTPRTFELLLDTKTATENTVTVQDRSGRVVAAADATVGNQGEVLTDRPALTQVDATTIDVGWVDSACDAEWRLTLDETASSLVLTRPVCSGDTIALARFVRLTFDGPIDATTIETSQDGPGA